MANIAEIDTSRLPRHVAVIMDGNGRWAEQRGKERSEGHVAGVASIRASIRAAQRNGVRYVTFYAFSTENWGRPAAEVEALMELLCYSVINETPDLQRQGVRVRVIGERARFSEKVQGFLNRIEADTAAGETLTMVLALNYSSRDELRRAVQRLAREAAAGTLRPDEITEARIAAALDTADMPDPDLVIRPGGEERISNFLLWQSAYSEYYFTDICWPDFNKEELRKALAAYQSRSRRFGGI